MMKSHEKAPPIIVQPERLRVRVNLLREPVAGEGQRQEGADRDEVADVSHPVVVRALLVGCPPAGT